MDLPLSKGAYVLESARFKASPTPSTPHGMKVVGGDVLISCNLAVAANA